MNAPTAVDPDQLKSLMAHSRAYLGEPVDWEAMAGYPNSLALCVIDSIQSTGPHYTSVMNVVSRYRGYRLGQGGNPNADGAHALLTTFDDLQGPDGWAEAIGNHNRTYQSKQAPLKSVAIQQAAQKLAEVGVDSTDDLRHAVAAEPTRLEALHAAWLSVVSQSSGITWDYFLMLGGIPGVKADRMVIRFVAAATGLNEAQVSPPRAAALVRAAVLARRSSGAAVDDLDPDRRGRGGVFGGAAQVGLGFDGEHAGHRGWIVGEVQSGAGADFDDPPGQPGEQACPVFGHAAAIHRRAGPLVEAGEQPMAAGTFCAHRRWRHADERCSRWSSGVNSTQPTWSSRRISQLDTASTSQPA